MKGNNGILADHATGRELQFVLSKLLALQTARQVNVGTLTALHARVKEYNGSQAVVEACERDTVQIASAATGQIVKPVAPTTELTNELVDLVGGVWKVEYGSNVSPGCT